MLVIACIMKRNSFPARLAGSPVQDSSVPNTAYLTPVLWRIFTNALVIFLARSSKLPAQPTQNKISGVFPGGHHFRHGFHLWGLVTICHISIRLVLRLIFCGPVQAICLSKLPGCSIVLNVGEHTVQFGWSC